jgi:hypothetical protein
MGIQSHPRFPFPDLLVMIGRIDTFAHLPFGLRTHRGNSAIGKWREGICMGHATPGLETRRAFRVAAMTTGMMNRPGFRQGTGTRTRPRRESPYRRETPPRPCISFPSPAVPQGTIPAIYTQPLTLLSFPRFPPCRDTLHDEMEEVPSAPRTSGRKGCGPRASMTPWTSLPVRGACLADEPPGNPPSHGRR